ncbi:hypothetical protein K461DRAFT_295665 [Myriangium duriaei CBS 260.36]|uniref:Uncharacterized protein n=1 Tax=Myriangium duriaei CBS 260.36 TaxID=1168546 RepID=A0A9P4IXP7_9PEZI|nr:hypothetical protein K461DRAFT_295665 [Myriangium duriaei CBS 260.36]
MHVALAQAIENDKAVVAQLYRIESALLGLASAQVATPLQTDRIAHPESSGLPEPNSPGSANESSFPTSRHSDAESTPPTPVQVIDRQRRSLVPQGASSVEANRISDRQEIHLPETSQSNFTSHLGSVSVLRSDGESVSGTSQSSHPDHPNQRSHSSISRHGQVPSLRIAERIQNLGRPHLPTSSQSGSSNHGIFTSIPRSGQTPAPGASQPVPAHPRGHPLSAAPSTDGTAPSVGQLRYTNQKIAPLVPYLGGDSITDTIDRKRFYFLIDRYRLVHNLYPFLDIKELLDVVPQFFSWHETASASSTSFLRGPEGIIRMIPRPASRDYLRFAILCFALATGEVLEWQEIRAKSPNNVVCPQDISSERSSVGNRPDGKASSGRASEAIHNSTSINYHTFHEIPSRSLRAPIPSGSHISGTGFRGVPGLKYFQTGSAILVPSSDTDPLSYAQARILAGIYQLQLGRTKSSWAWISEVWRICQRQVHSLESNARKLARSGFNEYEKSLSITFWSALQLETDMESELGHIPQRLAQARRKIPAPYISRVESLRATGVSITPITYFDARLILDFLISEIALNLLGEALLDKRPDQISQMLLSHEKVLEQFLQRYPFVGVGGRISSAQEMRLKVKYHIAQSTCLRPYLYYALKIWAQFRHVEELTEDRFERPRPDLVKLYSAIADMTDKHVMSRAKTCVESALVTVDIVGGIQDSLFVRNTEGISHGLFNMVSILAVTHDSHQASLRGMVTKDRLKAALQSAIAFIGGIPSRTLTAVREVAALEAINRRISAPPGVGRSSLSIGSTANATSLGHLRHDAS